MKIIITATMLMVAFLAGGIESANAQRCPRGDCNTRPNRPTTRPDRPTRPVEPTRPTRPTRPVEPTRPTRPTRPVEPTRPTRPVEPTRPTRPTRPGRGDRDSDKIELCRRLGGQWHEQQRTCISVFGRR